MDILENPSHTVCVCIFRFYPIDMPKERSIWIMVMVFSAFIFLIIAWTMSVKRDRCVGDVYLLLQILILAITFLEI